MMSLAEVSDLKGSDLVYCMWHIEITITTDSK